MVAESTLTFQAGIEGLYMLANLPDWDQMISIELTDRPNSNDDCNWLYRIGLIKDSKDFVHLLAI